MKFNKKLLAATLLTVGGFAAMSSANAAEATGTVPVSIVVEALCEVTSGTVLNMEAIKGGNAIAETTGGSTTLTVNCSKGALARIGLSPQSTTSTVGIGTMTGENLGETIGYKLTSVSATGGVWGNEDGINTVDPEAAAGFATDIQNVIYATLTDTADVKPDTYKDTINVSVLY